jgi:hypothetical protein
LLPESRRSGQWISAGSVSNFSCAATLIRVRNRSKDFWRSGIVDGTASPDTASNASPNAAQPIRRIPSGTSKRMTFPSMVGSALVVLLIAGTLHVLGRSPPTYQSASICRELHVAREISPESAPPHLPGAGRHRRTYWERIDIVRHPFGWSDGSLTLAQAIDSIRGRNSMKRAISSDGRRRTRSSVRAGA